MKRKTDFRVLIKIVQLECLKITDQEVAWKLMLLKAREIIECLLFRAD